MRIAAIVVTCERPSLLPRALESIARQLRPADAVFVVSNSCAETWREELGLCAKYGFRIVQNERTRSYSGALNTAVELIVQSLGFDPDVYFASLDDDDVWLPGYLKTLEAANTDDYDLLAANLRRKSDKEDQVLQLPEQLKVEDFLVGNPGLSGSNTFVRLQTLLLAGAFDEAMPATVDRDFMVRVLQQLPKCNIVGINLVVQYVDEHRPRLTTSGDTKRESLIRFHYKYQHLMDAHIHSQFLQRAKDFFGVSEAAFALDKPTPSFHCRLPLQFGVKGKFEFIIGFIAGDFDLCERVLHEITEKGVLADLVVVIDNTGNAAHFDPVKAWWASNGLSLRIVHLEEWQGNLVNGHYGSAFQSCNTINSIPLGRSILHHHLYTESARYPNPVFWIIDDDVTFDYLAFSRANFTDIFSMVGQHLGKVDAIVGGVTNDPPLPFLSTLRCQLVDFLHSVQTGGETKADHLKLETRPDCYYDLSDLHTDHVEFPVYHTEVSESALAMIFSGKAISRKVVQAANGPIKKAISQRGPNTLVLNRALLKDFPVLNLLVNDKFARRGDLLWAIFNQVVAGRKMIEHSLSVQQQRPLVRFDVQREVEKSAYDIIGYAFNKAILAVLESIKGHGLIHGNMSGLELLGAEPHSEMFRAEFDRHLNRRGTRFLMNYFRIIGLTQQLRAGFQLAADVNQQLSDFRNIFRFKQLLSEALDEGALKAFLESLNAHVESYRNSLDSKAALRARNLNWVTMSLGTTDLQVLGSGDEGVVYSDGVWVYKVFDSIEDVHWAFLKTKSECFEEHPYLAALSFYEFQGARWVVYPFHSFVSENMISLGEMKSFLQFCVKHEMVFSNLKASNFVMTSDGQTKYIDYGRSIEPFDLGRFVNSSKRAFILILFPYLADSKFQSLVREINLGKMPPELEGWQEFHEGLMG